jgi:phage terminase large subunit GpA-like protein
VSEWADGNRKLSSEASAESGQWDTSRAEYQRGIMDAASDPAVSEIVAMLASQTGKTEVVNNILGRHIDADPCPILLLQPTLEMAKAWSTDRLAPMLRDTPCLRGKVADAKSRDGGNSTLHKLFPGGHITAAGANSAASLAGRPIRLVLCDEVDRYPASAGAEGDPVTLAKRRMTTFWNRKLVLISTPTIEGASRIAAAYAETDRRRFFLACPACGHVQLLTWAQVKWRRGKAGEHLPETAAYLCERCPELWGDPDRWASVKAGRWQATAPFKGKAGFWLSALYSPWVTLAELAEEFLASVPFQERHKAFVNTVLAETWREQGEAPEWERLLERRDDWPANVVPRDVLFITIGADVQTDRIEARAWGWTRDQRRYLLAKDVFAGNLYATEPWDDLAAWCGQAWRHEGGAYMRAARVAIDTGYHTDRVAAWCRTQDPRVAMAVKGDSKPGTLLVRSPKPIEVNRLGRPRKTGTKPWLVNTDLLKGQLYGRFRLPKPDGPGGKYPPGYVHLSKDVCDRDEARQLTAEHVVTGKDSHGYPTRTWEKLGGRANEALDCAVYAHAAALAHGLERWTPRHWDALEESLGLTKEEPAEAPGHDADGVVADLDAPPRQQSEPGRKTPEFSPTPPRQPRRTRQPQRPRRIVRYRFAA